MGTKGPFAMSKWTSTPLHPQPPGFPSLLRENCTFFKGTPKRLPALSFIMFRDGRTLSHPKK